MTTDIDIEALREQTLHRQQYGDDANCDVILALLDRLDATEKRVKWWEDAGETLHTVADREVEATARVEVALAQAVARAERAEGDLILARMEVNHLRAGIRRVVGNTGNDHVIDALTALLGGASE